MVVPFSVWAANLAAGLVVAAALARLLLADGRAHLPPRGVIWAVAAFVGVHALATLLAAPAPQRWDKWVEEMWLKLLLLAVPVLGGGAPRQLRRAVQVAVLAGGAVAVYAIVQHFLGVEYWRGKQLEPIGGTYFALGFFSHHLSYGGQALLLWTFAGAWALERGLSRRRPVGWPFLAFLSLSLGLLWSFARSAQVGAAAGAAVLVLLQRGRKRRWGVAALAGVLVVAVAVPTVRMRFARFFEAGAEETRLNLWRSSLDGIAARPLLGWGEGNFSRLMERHGVAGFYDSRAHAHNDFLMHAVNAGLLGLAAALALLVVVTVLLWRGRRRVAEGGWVLLGGVAAQVAISVAGLFQVYQTDDEVEIALYLLLGCGLGLLAAGRAGGRSSRGVVALLAAVVLGAGLAGQARAEAIPRDAYLRYVPLEQPPLVERTRASAEFHLFGDPADPAYRDLDPVDGIDDARGRRLLELACRFGPIMVLNTTNLPMDFRRFLARSRSFNLHVDTWSLVGETNRLLRSDEVDLRSLTDRPCGEIPRGGRDAAGDCLLLDLLRRYDPYAPDYRTLAPRTVAPGHETFEVMFFDFPGEGPESWKAEFENSFSGLLPSAYRDFLRVYAHPFVHEAPAGPDGRPGYELILQYYFFYPTNDGGNDHEGDWEHVNVSVAPRGAAQRALTAREIRAILAGEDPDRLVIRYVDYYFHHQVYRMDYAVPDAYAAHQEWRRQRDAEVPELHGQEDAWAAIRANAWWDEEETVPNTHPICYIGADNKGLDQLLSPPGGRNRDSHGTYPFPGLYKDVGPGGAAEQINSSFDSKRWYREHGGDLSGRDQRRFGRGSAVPYASADRVEVLPDWECVLQPVMDDPAARRDWFWMLLPVRWGYPATESPFAGVVAHAETGNLSPLSPMSQPHWNRPGSEGGSSRYLPHSFDTLFPIGLRDSFDNSWGYLNLTLPVVAALPPADLAWRLAAYPVRRLLQRNDPVFFPAESIPTRFVGLNAGFSSLHFNEDAALLVFNGEPGLETLLLLAIVEPEGLARLTPEVPVADAWWWQVNFYLGSRFSTQNTLLHSRSRLAVLAVGKSDAEHRAETELNLWEFAGSLRVDLHDGNLRPYLKAGYGWTWFRTENATLDGVAMPTSEGSWTHRPSLRTFGSALPSSWHAGAGLEIVAYRSQAPFPQGIDASLSCEVTYTSTDLAIDDWLRVLGSGDLQNGLVDKVPFRRWTWSLGLTLGL